MHGILAPELRFRRRRKSRAAQADDARIGDALRHLIRRQAEWIRHGFKRLQRFILAIEFDGDRGEGQA